jgi:hypothetical protein
MQATIECEREATTEIRTPTRVSESLPNTVGTVYKAPLATFAVLLASARASARAAREMDADHQNAGSGHYR